MSPPLWVARLRNEGCEGWVVIHTWSGMRVGVRFGHTEALHVADCLNRDLPSLDIKDATEHHAQLLRSILGAAMALRPDRELDQYLCTITVRIPVWAKDAESARTLLQEMLENDEVYSYVDEFEPVLEVTELQAQDGGFNPPAYAVTPSGLEEVDRLPYVPVKRSGL